MPSRVSEWPADWPSFTPADQDPSLKDQQDLKRALVSEYGADTLKQAWVKTCRALDVILAPIAEQGPASVPVFQFEDVVGPQNQDILERMKAAGCFVIRGVIPREEANERFEEAKGFLRQNPDIPAWPVESPAIFSVFSSPVQLKLRTHPNQLKIQTLINSLFGDSNCSPDELKAQSEPILYPDAFRIRQPGQYFAGLGPHIDAGSLSRWANYSYRMTYDKILSGRPEEYDPYDLTHRRDANPAMYPGCAQCSALRTFQGWTALTSSGPGEGGLMLLPDIKTTTAYMILRPFFQPPEVGDWQDPEAWTLNDSTWFPGANRWDSQLLSPPSHPHLRLKETLVSTPAVQPGDTIWWHADVS